MSNNDTNFNTDGLDKLIKALEGELPVVRVGILGASTPRAASMELDEVSGESNGVGVSTVTNAEIGLKHEFGGPSTLPNGVTISLPQRSFLRVPLIENFQSYLVKSKAFDRMTMKQVLKEGTIVKWLVKLGIVGEWVVQDAFESGGFGKWQPSNMSFKANHQTLIETQQLQRSIISEVEE